MAFFLMWYKRMIGQSTYGQMSLSGTLFERCQRFIELQLTLRRHLRASEVLDAQLTDQLNVIKKSIQRYRRYTDPEYEPRQTAAYTFEAALSKATLLVRQRSELVEGFGAPAQKHIDAVECELVILKAEMILIRDDAERHGVQASLIEQRYNIEVTR